MIHLPVPEHWIHMITQMMEHVWWRKGIMNVNVSWISNVHVQLLLMSVESEEAQAPPTEADNRIYKGLGFASYSIHPH